MKQQCSAQNNDGGFTLIELLVVSALLAALAAILYGTLSGLLQGRALIDEQQETGRTAQYVLERMTRELTSRATVALGSDEDDESGDSEGRPRFGTRAYFIGENLQKGGADADRIRFVSSNATQGVFNDYPNFGMVEIEYRLEDPQGFTFKSGENEQSGYILVREEVPADVRNKDIRTGRRAIFPLAYRVQELNFRFMQDGKWEDEWQSRQNTLPEAIEITLALGNSENPEVYRTAIALSRPRRTR